MRKIRSILATVVFLSTLFVASADALSYEGYSYNGWDEAVPSQIGYEPEKVLNGIDFGGEVGLLSNPKDLFITEKNILILDSGKNRLIVLDKEFKAQSVLSEFKLGDESTTLNKPEGLFADKNGYIYIADTDNGRVIATDIDGNIKLEIKRPDSNLLDADLEFKPKKVMADSAGNIYISMTGVYQGALFFKSDGTFEGFFGSNTVELSAALILDRLWKSIMTDDQQDNISNYIPQEISAFDIDEKDFVYTITQTANIKKKIKKINPVGSDVLQGEEFGELEAIYVNGTLTASQFVDIAIDGFGNINVLDQQSNRVFQYDREGQPLFIFGGNGFQAGTFQAPVALAADGENILVLDSKKGNITVFTPTAFGKTVLQAVEYYNDGRYAEASELWESVLKLDHNYSVAYISLGKTLMAEKRYKEAEKYFRLGNYREGNSEAFAAVRNAAVQQWFPLICFLVVAFIVLFIWRFTRKNRKVKEEKEQHVINPFRFLMHPIESAEEMKLKKSGSIIYAIIILVVWTLSAFFEYSLMGFRFNTNNPDKMNVFLIFLRTVPLFLVWVVSNWGFCTLTNGKGRMKEIFVGSAYSLIPWVVSTYVSIIMSHVLVHSESVFMTWVTVIGIGWSILILLGMLSGIHEYSFGQTFVTTLMTILGVLIVVFLILLVCSLFQQAYMFVYSLINEILYRL